LRSFISINIDIKNKENIQKIQDLLKNKIDKPFLARFENPRNFHLTLFFIGEIDKVKLKEIFTVLKLNLENKFGELSFNCSEINAFPWFGKIRVYFF
jgi:2'-5' RNA ligase